MLAMSGEKNLQLKRAIFEFREGQAKFQTCTHAHIASVITVSFQLPLVSLHGSFQDQDVISVLQISLSFELVRNFMLSISHLGLQFANMKWKGQTGIPWIRILILKEDGNPVGGFPLSFGQCR